MNRGEFIKADARLRPRQREVLVHFLRGKRDDKIAKTLDVTQETIRKHLSDICKELPLSDRMPNASHRQPLMEAYRHHSPELFGNKPPYQTTATKILLSYDQTARSTLALILRLDAQLRTPEYEIFIADRNLRLIEGGRQHLFTALQQCDTLLLLLSKSAACSEVITDEVRLAKQHGDRPNNRKLRIIPIQIDCSAEQLNHDLRGYLQDISPLNYRSAEKNAANVVAKVLQLLHSDRPTPLTGKQNRLSHHELPGGLTIPTPHPQAEPELPRGQVKLASAFYVERPGVEARCYEMVVKPGSLIRIKAPRQMGKTSLLARILHHASQQGYATVPLSFQLIENEILSSLGKLLRWFCVNAGRQLDLPERLSDCWYETLGNKMACTNYFEQYLLTEISKPVVLGLDEVDVVFQYGALATDFFAMLRAWHEQAKVQDRWNQLRLVVVHSTEPSGLMDIYQSPFNVGLPIDLPEFQPEMVLDLAQRHGLSWEFAEVKKLMHMVGGHPFLVRLALYHIARSEIGLEDLLQTAANEIGIYSDHLRRHLWNLERHPVLATAMKQVVEASDPIQLHSTQSFKLKSLGLVQLTNNRVAPRCNLYRNYFQSRLQSS